MTVHTDRHYRNALRLALLLVGIDLLVDIGPDIAADSVAGIAAGSDSAARASPIDGKAERSLCYTSRQSSHRHAADPQTLGA